MMLDIHNIMRRLSIRRSIFHSRLEFHKWLVTQLNSEHSDCEIVPDYAHFPDDRTKLNIWVPKFATAITIRYPTKPLKVERNGEGFDLKTWMPPKARYDFLKDISKLEMTVESPQHASSGYAILLTNDHHYWINPDDNWMNTNDAEFRIHQDIRLQNELRWSEKAALGTVKGREEPIRLRGTYEMDWHDYSDLDSGDNSRFRYLAVEVSK